MKMVCTGVCDINVIVGCRSNLEHRKWSLIMVIVTVYSRMWCDVNKCGMTFISLVDSPLVYRMHYDVTQKVMLN